MIQQSTVIEYVIAGLTGNLKRSYIPVCQGVGIWLPLWHSSKGRTDVRLLQRLLQMPASGYRNNNNGNVNPSNNNNRANGHSVRCVRASVGGVKYPDLLTDLFTAYFCARENKRNTVAQVRFERNLSDNLMRLYDDIVSGRYQVGRSMCFIIRDPVLREVFAASFRDRIVRHLLYNWLMPIILLTEGMICQET